MICKNGDKVLVRAFVQKEIKEQAVDVLSSMGLTQSDVINDLFKYIATYKDVPFDKEEIVIFKER